MRTVLAPSEKTETDPSRDTTNTTARGLSYEKHPAEGVSRLSHCWDDLSCLVAGWSSSPRWGT